MESPTLSDEKERVAAFVTRADGLRFFEQETGGTDSFRVSTSPETRNKVLGEPYSDGVFNFLPII